MAADKLYIGIDSGTQGCKAAVFSMQQGAILAEAGASHTLKENDRGGREQDPAQWIRAMEQALAALLGQVDRSQVRAMGVSGQQHGCVPLDSDGQVIRPAKLWCDTETVDQCRRLTLAMGGEQAVLAETGNTVAVGFTASKVLWLKENEPENYRRLTTILLPHDYLNFYLTGNRCTEYGDASGTAYFDVRSRSWSKKMLSVIDHSGRLENCLPGLVDADAPCGRLRRELADRWGLGSEVLVSSGGGDNMMAAIGTGNVRPGVVTASLGTSGTIYAHSDRPVVDTHGELAAFCSSSGGWLPLVCTMNVTVATERIRELIGAGIEELNHLAAAAAPGADGILLLPYFNGERTPALPGATATLYGMTAVNCNRKNLSRAAMEGATLGLRYGLGVLERCGIRPAEIRLVGGGARSPLWRQMIADVFNLPVVAPKTAEAGALGAALQALWCDERQRKGNVCIQEICDRFIKLDEASRTEPGAAEGAIYQDVYRRYLALDRIMRPLNS